MRAVLFNRKSSTKKFNISELSKPIPKEDQVLVKVHTVSPNAADYRSIQMRIVPKHKILGSAISGTVEAIGKNIQNFKVGDEVIGDLADSGLGGFAEYTATTSKAFTHKTAGVTFQEATALPVAATTALQALRKGDIEPGEKVLIIGAAGGVGTFAVQLAKYFGAYVSAVCSTKSVAQSKELGADEVIDYTKEDIFQKEGTYDLILAINGNYPLLKCKRKLKKNAKYVAVGGDLRQVFKALLFGKFLSWGDRKMGAIAAKPITEDLAYVAELVREGKIKPIIEKVYSLEDTDEAMEYLGNGHVKGKIVIQL